MATLSTPEKLEIMKQVAMIVTSASGSDKIAWKTDGLVALTEKLYEKMTSLIEAKDAPK
jgi:hypothetical protein